MIDLKQLEAWFVTGSQGLYGKETLDKVAEHAREIARELSASSAIPVTVVFKPVVTIPGRRSSSSAARRTTRRTASA